MTFLTEKQVSVDRKVESFTVKSSGNKPFTETNQKPKEPKS
jgi:hypothetical protein